MEKVILTTAIINLTLSIHANDNTNPLAGEDVVFEEVDGLVAK